MIRTFHSKIDKTALFCCLLPSTILAVYFFWEKLAVAALPFLLLMVVLVERQIHTSYIFTDDGFLWIDRGRFSKKCRLALSDVKDAEIVHTSAISLLKSKDTVMLTLGNGSLKFITPFPAEDFCRCLKQKKEEGR